MDPNSFGCVAFEINNQSRISYLGRGSPRVIPAILLARLALDRMLHGQGFGAQLLVDSLQRAVSAVNAAGGRLIVVDTLHERATNFYSQHGFTALPTTPLRLVMKSPVAAASLNLPV